MALLTMLALLLPMAGCGGPLTLVVGVTPGDKTLEVTEVYRDPEAWSDDRVAMIDLSGLIYNRERSSLLSRTENPVSLLHEQLKQVEADDSIKAVIVRINSAGGTVTASEMVYTELHEFRQRTGKPTIALLMDVATSGAYFAALGTDQIIAHQTTITGSIGVIVQTISFKPILDRWGIQAVSITSGDNKAAGSPLTTLTPKQQAIFQTIVDGYYQRFSDRVRDRRPALNADQNAWTDGRILTGYQAHGMGLIDELGGWRTAFARAKELADVEAAVLLRYHRPLDYVASPYALGGMPAPGQGSESTQVNLVNLGVSPVHGLPGLPGATAGFYYLWQPLGP